jgi:hypothetical protein
MLRPVGEAVNKGEMWRSLCKYAGWLLVGGKTVASELSSALRAARAEQAGHIIPRFASESFGEAL